MKSYQKVIIVCCLVIPFTNCNRSDQQSFEQKSPADSTAIPYISSSAATGDGKDSNRKFIRTANLRFKAKNVIKSTYAIEDVVRRHQGFVINTNLQSQIDNTVSTPVSSDSTLETTYYTVSNTVTLRIPNANLDTTLKEISENIDYLDFRIITAEDVSLQMLSNNLIGKRNGENKQRLTKAIDTRGKKLAETIAAEETLLNKQIGSDDANISTLSLLDKIQYSTINIFLYQRQAIREEVIPGNKNIPVYEPSFTRQLAESGKFGLKTIEAVLILLAKLWGVLLFLLLIYLGYKLYSRQSKKLSL